MKSVTFNVAHLLDFKTYNLSYYDVEIFYGSFGSITYLKADPLVFEFIPFAALIAECEAAVKHHLNPEPCTVLPTAISLVNDLSQS